jgi:transposase
MDTIVMDGAADGCLVGEIGSRRRRRTFSDEQKRRMVAECEDPGASVSLVARRYDVNANLLFTWRRQLAPKGPPTQTLDLIPIGVVEAPPPTASVEAKAAEHSGVMEIALPNGARVRVDASVDERALRRVLAAMKAAG